MIVICQNDFPIGVLPGATEEQAEAFIKKMRADSDAAITDPRQVRPAFHWHDVPVMKAGNWSYHPCTNILIEGLKRLEGGSDVLAEWDRARAKADTALAQQPAAEGARGKVKVGDRVRAIRDGSSYYRKGDCGTVVSIDRDGDFWVRWDNPIVPDAGYGWFIYQHNCERITQQQWQAAADDMGGFSSDTAALAFLHIIGNGNPNVERAVERLRQSLIAQQPAAVDEVMVKRAVAAVMSAPAGISVESYVRIVLEAALTQQPAAICTCPHQDAREPHHDVACPARLAQHQEPTT